MHPYFINQLAVYILLDVAVLVHQFQQVPLPVRLFHFAVWITISHHDTCDEFETAEPLWLPIPNSRRISIYMPGSPPADLPVEAVQGFWTQFVISDLNVWAAIVLQ